MSLYANEDDEYDGLHLMMFGTTGLKTTREEENMSASKQVEVQAVAKVKPTVHYFEQLAPVVVGQRAMVTAASHPVLGRASLDEYLNTSMVVSVGEDGTTFETLNTLYVQREKPVDVV